MAVNQEACQHGGRNSRCVRFDCEGMLIDLTRCSRFPSCNGPPYLFLSGVRCRPTPTSTGNTVAADGATCVGGVNVASGWSLEGRECAEAEVIRIAKSAAACHLSPTPEGKVTGTGNTGSVNSTSLVPLPSPDSDKQTSARNMVCAPDNLLLPPQFQPAAACTLI